MKKIIRYLAVLSVAWAPFCWANKALVTPTYPMPLGLSSDIHTVRVSGRVHVRIYESQHPQLSGELLDLKRSVHGDEIKLSSKDPITFDLGLSHLEIVQASGDAHVSAYVKTPAQLTVDLADCASVSLTGKPHLASLNLSGKSQFKAMSLVSSGLDVDVKNHARAIIGGTVDHLTVNMLNQAFLDATGLLANHVWVSAAGQSIAHLGRVHTMRAYADEQGEVFRYGTSVHLTQRSQNRANILSIN